ncbi:MAG TPA: prolyl aminopeptidase [Aliidongia sp.]|nr:prolyl aminopeptidase [Aliidongia sp.]
MLYPEIDPFAAGLLPVGNGHRIAWECSGNPAGLPIIFLHGGPGGATRPIHRRFFDPSTFRIVLLDQRGCGRSEPWSSLEGNNPQTLVADLEALRHHLGIERWALAGGSWGSCLAMLYGQTHPDRCLGFRLRGVFTGRASEIDWWWRQIGALFPEAFEALENSLPADERHDLLSAYAKRAADPDAAIHTHAAQALKLFSARTSTFRPDPELIDSATDLHAALPLTRFFTHYCVNRFFLEEGQILANLGRISHLPCEIVQGRYDVVTPPATAWAVHRAWPGSRISMVVEGNHTDLEPAMMAAMVAATDRLRDRLMPGRR